METAPLSPPPSAATHLEEEFDLDFLLDSNPPDLFPILEDDAPPPPSHRLPTEGETSSGAAGVVLVDQHHRHPSSSWSWVDEIERLLMGEDKDEPFFYKHSPSEEYPLSALDFFANDDDENVPTANSPKLVGDRGVVDVKPPEEDKGASENPPSEKDPTSRDGGVLPLPAPAPLVDGEEKDDDAAAKKRRRQLRNRDSAVKSRQRRKQYVQDLERKSKFLEGECRRLHQLLQCCTAENLALRHHLQKDRLHGVPNARQESAVLFEESLLLGSLFWLVNMVFLFLIPNLAFGVDLERALVTKRVRSLVLQQRQETMGARDVGEESSTLELSSEAIVGRRRFKAYRRKMRKFPPIPFLSPLSMCYQCIACV